MSRTFELIALGSLAERIYAVPETWIEAECGHTHIKACRQALERPWMSVHGGKHSQTWQRAACVAMGTSWMKNIVEVCEAIPPAYTRWVGEQFLSYLDRAA